MPFRRTLRLRRQPAWVAAGALWAALSLSARAAEPPVAETLETGPAPAIAADSAAPAPVVREESVPDGSVPDSAEASGGSAASPATAAPTAAPAEAAPPGEGDIVVEVDPRQSRNRDRSLPLAMLFSAALPGAGELYLREKPQAKTFFLVEAGFWASLYAAFLARESFLSSARNYASEYAGIDAAGKSAGFLETMANFRSYQEKQHRQDSYELAQILSGKRDRDYPIKPVEANYWDFGSSANPENTRHWNTFQSTLRYYRGSKVAISFAIGALAFNRLASLANTLRVYRHTSAQGLGLNVTPEFGPESVGSRISLRF